MGSLFHSSSVLLTKLCFLRSDFTLSVVRVNVFQVKQNALPEIAESTSLNEGTSISSRLIFGGILCAIIIFSSVLVIIRWKCKNGGKIYINTDYGYNGNDDDYKMSVIRDTNMCYDDGERV